MPCYCLIFLAIMEGFSQIKEIFLEFGAWVGFWTNCVQLRKRAEQASLWHNRVESLWAQQRPRSKPPLCTERALSVEGSLIISQTQITLFVYLKAHFQRIFFPEPWCWTTRGRRTSPRWSGDRPRQHPIGRPSTPLPITWSWWRGGGTFNNVPSPRPTPQDPTLHWPPCLTGVSQATLPLPQQPVGDHQVLHLHQTYPHMPRRRHWEVIKARQGVERIQRSWNEVSGERPLWWFKLVRVEVKILSRRNPTTILKMFLTSFKFFSKEK